jgi:predicted RNA binding protein YcfA (HicA-like mRNA interferase family)
MINEELPILKPRKVISILKKLGFVVIKTRENHKLLMHEDLRRTTIPLHKNRPISPILFDKILKDIYVGIEEFSKYL